jgi:L-Ala-D/L-Glu epimerase / N-acetyl-D-glutamate racemase
MPEAMKLAHERVELKLRCPLVFSRGAQDGAVVLRVAISWRGVTGYGEAAPQEDEGQTLEAAEAFLDELAAQLGSDPFALEEIDARMRAHEGDLPAKAAVDAALHDLTGKLLDQPTWRILGLRANGPPTSLTLPIDTPDAMAARGREDVGRLPELAVLKLKLGAGDGHDLDRVQAVAEATGLPLTVDANEGWTADEAFDLIPRLVQLGVRIVEQPLPRTSEDAVALKRRSPLPVFVDEECYTLQDVAPVADRAHGINIKLVKCGGIREAVRMIHAARALGLGVMLGCMVESGLGIAAAAQISSLVDGADLDANLLLVEDPSPGVAFVGGVQVAGSRPGLGMAA